MKVGHFVIKVRHLQRLILPSLDIFLYWKVSQSDGLEASPLGILNPVKLIHFWRV